MAVANPVLPDGWMEAAHGWRITLLEQVPGTWTMAFEAGKTMVEGPDFSGVAFNVKALLVKGGVITAYRDVFGQTIELGAGSQITGFSRLYAFDVLTKCAQCDKPFVENDVLGVSYEDAQASVSSFCNACEWQF